MKKSFKYLNLLLVLDITIVAIINVISGKIIQIFFLTLSAASLCDPFTYIFGDLFTEVYGYKYGRRATWLLLFSTIIMAVIFQAVVYLPPAHGFKENSAYTFVLSQVPRVTIGAWIAWFFGQFVNDFVMAKMKLLTKGKYLWTRTIGSTILGQVFDTTLFYTIALYNVIPTGLLLNSILSAWFLKVFIEIVMTPVTYYVVNKLKRIEHEDYFDKNTNFNPLIVQVKSD